MKSYHYFSMALLTVATFLSACSSDRSDPETVTDHNMNAKSYMTIKIVSPTSGMSRAAGDPTYENGTVEENKINNLHFFFYANDGSYITKGIDYKNVTTTPQVNGGNVEAISDAIVALGPTNDKKVEKVLAVLNVAPDKAAEFEGKTLNKAKQLSSDSYSYTESGIQYFTMTGSTYKENPDGTAEVKDENIASSETDAQTKNPVTIYVERQAAKVKVTTNENFTTTLSVGNGEDKRTIRLKVLGYALGNLEPTSYLIKHVSGTTDYFNTPAWSIANNHRSFWAEDPHYTKVTYPADDNAWKADAPLTYISFTDIEGHTELEKGAYCLENTFDKTAFASYKQAATSVLVGVQMTLDDGKENDDIIRYYGKLYTTNGYKDYVLKSQGVPTDKLYKTEGNTTKGFDPETDLEIKDLGNGYVTLKVKDGVELKEQTGNTPAVTDKVYNLSEKLANLERANGFKGGRMYYAIPIKHLVGRTDNEGNDWTQPTEVGQYGVVRNHVYTINLNSITGIGHAVWNPGENIVPNTPSEYYIGATINILAWRVVPVQNADLK